MVPKKRKKRRIPPHFLEQKYFDELGYQEFDILYDKFIELFTNKKYKEFNKKDIIRLAKLIGDRCSIEAEALHETDERVLYYKKIKIVSECGLRLSKK